MPQSLSMPALFLVFLVLSILVFLILFFIFKHRLKKVKDIVRSEIEIEVVTQVKENIKELDNEREIKLSELDITIKDLTSTQEKLLSEKVKLEELKENISNYELEMEKYGEGISIQEKIINQKNKLKRLMSEVMKYERILEMQEFGVYKPSFDFDTSEQYKQEMLNIKEKQKQEIEKGQACVCNTPWTIDGSRAKGILMEKNAIKLAIRSFNNECEAIIAKVNFRNVNQSIERIKKSYEQLNKLNSKNDVVLQYRYLGLKLDELKLAYEYAVKKEDERLEQLRIKEEMREELKAQKELEKAKLEAEKQQREYEKELEYTRKLLAKDQQNSELKRKLELLEYELKQAIERGERAISQAQLTKSGHVYVISNIGSFGKDVYKIGMTRRLEPLDRVRELGDASVPFSFDVHAMIYSENAPSLERELHKIFANKQVNRVNPRKEFFKVPLDVIKEEAYKLGAKVEFTMLAEAKEYFESLELERENKYTEISSDEPNDLDELIDNI